VWGPISISALRQDKYEHVTDGYAADAEILYLDEVGRASPAILDSLLHLLGPERQALIGTKQIAAPLVTAVGSANSWPEDAAMLDRWLLRATVAYLAPSQRRQLLTFAPPTMAPAISLADLKAAQVAARSIQWSNEAYDVLDQILADLDEAGISVSDRRLRASAKVAQAQAVINGHDRVYPIDLEPLQFVLWSVPDQAAVAAQKVVARANPMGAKLDEMLAEADEVARSATDAATRLDAATKLESLLKEAQKVAAQPGANGRAAKVVKYIEREHFRIQARALNLPEAKVAAMLATMT
jgi:MoxR-like ATPase